MAGLTEVAQVLSVVRMGMMATRVASAALATQNAATTASFHAMNLAMLGGPLGIAAIAGAALVGGLVGYAAAGGFSPKTAAAAREPALEHHRTGGGTYVTINAQEIRTRADEEELLDYKRYRRYRGG